jgi:hypothetical protein
MASSNLPEVVPVERVCVVAAERALEAKEAETMFWWGT